LTNFLNTKSVIKFPRPSEKSRAVKAVYLKEKFQLQSINNT